ncbi:glucose-6-phosphate dehydrogenase [Lacticaseibacillus thailandensis]|uniref:Glucose-6-phosphate 1-dehydrogenase n=1 Tax=Lacticaseibacillus thailandensis DSM 22698 = JCM 13996 TaxID=1423810 RepID=A0A0R2CGP4_9LACO|nr:glucose-6-phosphate dehydrogenase [Lacticaseibacillus thailandensis]KRM86835.1 Glucose-6-phosphate 1-dehydrogenase [Lacticaseibacillus thailandensis DSM 22698 = JCM 13996]
MTQEQASVITIFGGSGDLARRKLYPALFQLYRHGILRDHFAVIGTARRPWSNEYYRDIIATSLEGEAGAVSDAVHAFASHFYYQSHDVTDADHYVTLRKLSSELDDRYQVGGNRLFYMAMAPRFFGIIASHIRSEHLLSANGYNRLVIEKPFGRDFASAKELNDSINAAFDEDQIYRIDHYLGKEMVQSLMAVRFANPMFKAVWNHDYIDNVQITLAEAVGVEERAGYYETAGALRDMVQNHIMQLIAYVAMPEPESLTPNAVHQAKRSILESLKPLTPEDAAENFVRGQYVGDTPDQPDYVQEEGVAADSKTETFVAGRIELTDSAWTGVPFYVRTGKHMTRKSTQITVNFKPTKQNIFAPVGCNELAANSLTIFVEPEEGYRLVINGKQLGQDFHIGQFPLNFRHDANAIANAPEAYEHLLQDALAGNQTNFTRWHELKATWQYVDKIRQAWDASDVMPTYKSGSMGPDAAAALLAKYGDHWSWDGSAND